MSFDKHPIKDLPLKILDGDRGKKYPKQNDFYNEGFCLFLNTGNVTSNGFVFTNCSFISKERHNLLRKGTLQRGDIVLTTRGTVGNCAFYGSKTPFEVVRINSGMIILRAEEGLEAKYLYCFLRSNIFSKQIKALRTGSAQPQLPIRDIREIVIPKPSIEEQKAIAHILGTLDEKIELNKKTNETLEGITKSIFKSWFIDFDPVRAKAEGRSTGLPDEISDLFADSLEDSELGEIPYSWGEIPLSDLIISIKERQGEQNLDEFSATTSGIEHRDKKFQKVLAKSSNKNKVAIEGDIVFGLSRKVLNFGRMPYSIGGFSSVYEVFRSKDEGKIPTQIIEKYIRTKMSKFMDILKPAAREGQAIDREVLLQKRIPKFPSDLFHYFRSITKSIDSMISLKSKEIDLLEEIRDKLATKLISGELRIPDAEKMIEEVSI